MIGEKKIIRCGNLHSAPLFFQSAQTGMALKMSLDHKSKKTMGVMAVFHRVVVAAMAVADAGVVLAEAVVAVVGGVVGMEMGGLG